MDGLVFDHQFKTVHFFLGHPVERGIEEIWSYLDNLMTDKQTDKLTNGLTELFLAAQAGMGQLIVLYLVLLAWLTK